MTYVEFEEDGINFVEDDVNKQMPSPSTTKFIFPYYTQEEKVKLLENTNEKDFLHHANMPRKGSYFQEVGGYKAFNNAFQSDDGLNGMLEEWWRDPVCKRRYVFVTATALINGASAELIFEQKAMVENHSISLILSTIAIAMTNIAAYTLF